SCTKSGTHSAWNTLVHTPAKARVRIRSWTTAARLTAASGFRAHTTLATSTCSTQAGRRDKIVTDDSNFAPNPTHVRRHIRRVAQVPGLLTLRFIGGIEARGP